MKKTKIYSINQSRQILKTGYRWYKKRRHQLNPLQLQQYEQLLSGLDQAVLSNKKEEASELGHQVEEFYTFYFKKGFWDYFLEGAFALGFALIVATIIRQSWFEPYEIPTGSMRPTFEEQDHLTVSKTAFGINIPLVTDHFYFEPKNVQRTGIVIWSGDQIPNLDSDATFMGVFPYTKRYIKRCMGKPGDTLYFYGGKIFGFDEQGNDLVELRDNPWTAHLDHIPFTSFEGREALNQNRQGEGGVILTLNHFNQKVGRLLFNRRDFRGEVFNGKEWIKDDPEAQRFPHDTIKTYSDWWGIRNFAMARLLTRDQVDKLTSYSLNDMAEGVLYLELRHTPSLSYPNPLVHERGTASIQGYTTIIPLQDKHLQALMQNMYTCRFIVKDEKSLSYGQTQMSTLDSIKHTINQLIDSRLFYEKKPYSSPYQPLFPEVANGTYEFYYGKGVKVGWGAITSPLESTNPLLSKSPENIQKLYNVGIQMTTIVAPQTRHQLYFPNRYVYFKDGDLYTMGGLFMEKDDPILTQFKEKEVQKEKVSTKQNPYVAFKDYGPPLKEDGTLDKDFIKAFGLKIPDHHYLMLGDNHAMSQDSRYFGFIPETNLQGVPSLIVWPPGERWGVPNQKPYPLFPLSRLIIWSIAGLIAISWFIFHRYQLKKPIFKKLH